MDDKDYSDIDYGTTDRLAMCKILRQMDIKIVEYLKALESAVRVRKADDGYVRLRARQKKIKGDIKSVQDRLNGCRSAIALELYDYDDDGIGVTHGIRPEVIDAIKKHLKVRYLRVSDIQSIVRRIESILLNDNKEFKNLTDLKSNLNKREYDLYKQWELTKLDETDISRRLYALRNQYMMLVEHIVDPHKAGRETAREMERDKATDCDVCKKIIGTLREQDKNKEKR